MADNVGQIYISLDLDSKKFKSGLADVRSSAHSFTNSINSYFQDSVQASKQLAVGIAGVGTAIAGSVAYFAKIAGNLESARQGFVNLLGSAQKADDVIAQIKKDAKETPFELPGLIQANLLLTSVTKNGTKSEKILLDVGKALASAGKGQAELDRVILNLQQIGLTGKITAMDIRQFGSAGINILELLADYYGKTAGEAVEMVQNSKNAFADLEGAFAKAGGAGGRFENSFKLQAGTFNQLLSNMKDSLGIFGTEVLTKSGIFDALKKGMSNLLDYLDKNKDTITKSIINGLQWIKDNGEIVAGVITGILAPAIINSVASIIASLASISPWILVFAVIGIAIGAIIEQLGGWDRAMKALTSFIDTTVKPALQSLIERFGGFDNIIKTVTDFIDRNAKPTLQLFKDAWDSLKPSIVAVFNTVSNELIPKLQEFWQIHGANIIEFLKIFSAILGLTVLGAIYIFINAVNLTIKVIGWLIDAFNWVYLKNKEFSESWIYFWTNIRQFILNMYSDIYNGIKAPFERAFNWIKGEVGKVKEALNNLNPWKRQSPSLIDNIQSGSKQIITEYSQMFNKLNELSVGARPQLMANGLALGAGTNISTAIYGGVSINNRADADYLLNRISFNDEMFSRGLTA